MHRALPHAAMGMKAGGLVPPRGTLVQHGGASVHDEHRHAGKTSSKGGQTQDGEAADAEWTLEPSGRGLRAIGSRSGDGQGGAGSDAGHGDAEAHLDLEAYTPDGVGEEAVDGQGEADNPEGHTLRGAKSAQAVQSASELDARLLQGELVWATSLKLAMECAQMHPGADIFVQAFNLVDAEGNVITLGSRRGRLRATGGHVQAFANEPRPGRGAAAQDATPDVALMQELQDASLLALSLRPVVDESGRAQSALAGVPFTELAQLNALFERPWPNGLRDSVCKAAEEQMARWRAACARDDFEARLALHGDVIEREVLEQRARLSTTIASAQTNAHRARANWLRAQAQVQQWARARERPRWALVMQINQMLGEGLAPWNKPEQAKRVGARYGELRGVDVVCGAPPQYFLRADQLPQAMIELFEWYEQQARFELHPLLLAAQMQQRLITLHPFADANGRTARLVMDWITEMAGWPPAMPPECEMALFPNEAEHAQHAPGLAERTLLQGLRTSVALHLEWLHLTEEADEPFSAS
jgi:hypothetical protein